MNDSTKILNVAKDITAKTLADEFRANDSSLSLEEAMKMSCEQLGIEDIMKRTEFNRQLFYASMVDENENNND